MKKIERFYCVNEIGYITIEKIDITKANVFVEMKAQGLERKTPDDLVMIFTREQIIEMYNQVGDNLSKNTE
jgi:hypothetical protein